MSLLLAESLSAGYGPSDVLHDLDFSIERSEIVVMLGANGMGKTTTMRAVSGGLARRGVLNLNGKSIIRSSPDSIVRMGICQVPQGRGTLGDLTVEENLRIGAHIRKDRNISSDMDRWFETFPRLRERRRQKAGLLSGGEQQMLAIARSMMSKPQLLLCDEPSLGLAPKITQELFQTLRDLNEELGVAMLIVEQNAQLALRIAQRAYLLELGRIIASGTAADFREDDQLRAAYLGY
jgi:branched-chain amino acid transport system ATP-binding protein